MSQRFKGAVLLVLLAWVQGCAPMLPRIAHVEPAGLVKGGVPAGLFAVVDLAPIITAASLPAGIPAGEVLVDGVPFHLGGGVVDVGRSMAGIEEPFRTAEAYHDPKSSARFGRLAAPVPSDSYEALHLLAWSSPGGGLVTVPRLTVRIGVGAQTAIYEDVTADVPSLRGGSAPLALTRVPVVFTGGVKGQIYHLRIPLDGTAGLQGLAKRFELEFTRDVRAHVTLPDPSEFTLVPAGHPSGVKVLAATLSRSPLVARFGSEEPGNIFYEGTPVLFRAKLSNRDLAAHRGTIRVRCAGPGTGDEADLAWFIEKRYDLEAGAQQELEFDLRPPSGKRGWYEARFEAVEGARMLQSAGTTFAVLAPDSRRAGAESPFGVWNFFGAHNVVNPPDLEERLGSIMRKGGWRYTYGGQLKGVGAGGDAYREMKERHGVRFTLQSPPHSYQRKEGWYDPELFGREVVPWLTAARARGYDPFYKVLHESRSSVGLIRRFPETLGGPAYEMPEAERSLLEAQVANVTAYTRALKAADPEARVVLINDYPAVGVEYMKRGFPKDAFDVFGSEGANFMREPERQPDWLSLLGNLHAWRREMERYGYAGTPLWMTEALYHGTNPGNLTLQRQAVIAVREAMLALANGVERLAATGVLVDASDDYTWSNWGSVGFCFRAPEFNPKPSFAMYAWLTQVLDGMRYRASLETGSTSLHVLDFADGSGAHVFPVWVVRGAQQVRLRVAGEPQVFDAYGNRVPAAVIDGTVALRVTESPLYVTGAMVLGIATRTPVEIRREAGQPVLEFDDSGAFEVVRTRSGLLEKMWAYPMVKGDFEVRFGKVDGSSSLEVRLSPDAEPGKLFQRYVELALKKPVPLPGRPGTLTARVRGNGGWGRVIFEVVDAAGRVWTSSGSPSVKAMNSSDTKGDSFVSFDGWQTMHIPLPGQYLGADQFVAWPGNYDWYPSGTPECERAEEESRMAAQCDLGIAAVSWPLKLTKVIVAMPPNILYVNREMTVADPAIAIDRIGVIEASEGM